MILGEVEGELQKTDWYRDAWLEGVINQIPNKFNQACERWRGLYQAAKGQQAVQQKIINDMSRPALDREQARRLRQEAESQLELLTDAKNLAQSDFYSYRYFASEGFIPGYSFPRLPLSAFIPGRRIRGDKDEFLFRPRFLAISEVGPQSIIYHEGSRYTISKVNLPISESGDGVATTQAKHCPACGYFHPESTGNQDRCERCHAQLVAPITPLFRLQNVSTRRRDRISSDEEERMRQGYELRTAIRFQETQTGDLSAQSAKLMRDGEELATLTYLGGTKPIDVDVRLILASNRPLKDEVAAGRFRQDLFLRVQCSPSRCRRCGRDVTILLAWRNTFWFAIDARSILPCGACSPQVVERLQAYDWPGNVRELEGVIQRGLVLASGESLGLSDLPADMRPSPASAGSVPWSGDATLEEVEIFWIRHVLERCGGNRTQAARRLGIDQSTLWRKLKGCAACRASLPLWRSA